MPPFRLAALGALAIAVAACSTVAPVKVSPGEQCFRCRRLILDTRVAGETIDRNGFVSKFRGPGCMATYLAAHPDDRATVLVTDYDTGKMVPAAKAFYVRQVVDARRGEIDYRAYVRRADADALAADTHTTAVTWEDLVASVR